MTFKIHQAPTVEQGAEQRLLFEIERARKTMKSPHELIEHVIKLYGDEFVKVNSKIAALESSLVEQKQIGNELFLIKQKLVIVNRELMERNHQLSIENNDLRMRVGQISHLLERAAIDFSRHIELRALLDIEEHKIKAEDTPA